MTQHITTEQSPPADLMRNEVIETRFGPVAVARKDIIFFPRGLLGMPQRQHFFLTGFPNEALGKFRILQSLEDRELSFITLPVALKGNLIAPEDVIGLAAEMKIALERMTLLVLVSIHHPEGKMSISINTRAPLVIDSDSRIAAQHVFSSSRYKVQHFLAS